jgi:hypothetical protein
VSFPIRSFTNGVSSSGPETTLSVRNQITKKTNVGLSLTVGTLATQVNGDPSELRPDENPQDQSNDQVEGDSGNGTNALEEGQEGSRQTFERLLFHVSTSPTPRFSFDGSIGVEARTVSGSTTFNPTFGLGATWRPTNATSVSLAAESRIFSSAAALDTNYTSTSFKPQIQPEDWLSSDCRAHARL